MVRVSSRRWRVRRRAREPHIRAGRREGKGVHSFTFQLNVSAFCGIGGAVRSGVVSGEFRGCQGVLGSV